MDYYLGGEGQADAVDVMLQDARGKTVGKRVTVPLAAGRITTKISTPSLWTAETPALYTALVQLKQGKKVLHKEELRPAVSRIFARLKFARAKVCLSTASMCCSKEFVIMLRGRRWDVHRPTELPLWMWI